MQGVCVQVIALSTERSIEGLDALHSYNRMQRKIENEASIQIFAMRKGKNRRLKFLIQKRRENQSLNPHNMFLQVAASNSNDAEHFETCRIELGLIVIFVFEICTKDHIYS